jgi:hypothetical protein
VTDNFKVVPYQRSHGDYIIHFGMNEKLMDVDASYQNNRIDHEEPGMAFTLLHNDLPVVSGGVILLWDGVGEGWVMSSKRIFDYKITAASIIKKRLDLICENNKIWRLQTSVKAKFTTGIRFATWLGLTKEGLMRKFGPDGSDYYKMAKIYI